MSNTDIVRILDAACALAVDDGWHSITLSHIAEQSGLTLAVICRYVPTPSAIPVLLARYADSQVLAETPPGEQLVRDNLFDVLMRRFDALFPYRAGIIALCRPDKSAIPAVFAGGGQLLISMGLMLDMAGDQSRGVVRMMRQTVLAGLWLRVARVWLRDNNPDLAQTMAALDRDLNTAEMLANSIEEGPFALVRAFRIRKP